MGNRVRHLLAARIAAEPEGAGVPIAALVMHGFVALVLCGLARGTLPPFAYALFALSLVGALCALTLIGELGALLFHDESGDWVRALPVTPFDLQLARALHVLRACAVLASAPVGCAVLVAPASMGAIARLELALGGFGLVLALAAGLIWLQTLLGGRAEGLLVLVQTLLFAAAVIGTVMGARLLGALREIEAPSGAWAWFPPTWFAWPIARPGELAPPLLLAGGLALALGALFVVPAAKERSAGGGADVLGRLLAPWVAMIRRLWVRRDERASFELVLAGLPREREFVLRTYPLIGVPVAFLAIGARGDTGSRAGLLALLLFVTSAYLPILSAHSVVSRSFRARWLLDLAPVERASLDRGAQKALFVRFIAPLFVVLLGLCFALGEARLALLLGPSALVVAWIVLVETWSVCVVGPPLSTAPEDLSVQMGWASLLMTLAILLTLASVALQRWVTTPLSSVIVFLVLFAAAWRGSKPRGRRTPT